MKIISKNRKVSSLLHCHKQRQVDKEFLSSIIKVTLITLYPTSDPPRLRTNAMLVLSVSLLYYRVHINLPIESFYPLKHSIKIRWVALKL
jgi:hypothetical protein